MDRMVTKTKKTVTRLDNYVSGILGFPIPNTADLDHRLAALTLLRLLESKTPFIYDP